MKRHVLVIAMTAMVLAPALAVAQPPDPKVRSGLKTWAEVLDKNTAPPIYEDIEVMRRLLASKLSSREHVASTMNSLVVQNYLGALTPRYTTTQGGSLGLYSDGRSSLTSVDGVYLDGKGVVFTATVPVPAQDARPTSAPATAKPQSDWERTRQQLRGDPADPVAKPETTAPTIGDVLVNVLAENGRHLRLNNNEDVIIVVNFKSGSARSVAATNVDPSFVDVPINVPGGGAANPLTPGAEPAVHRQSFRDFVLLGDLHLRQQQYSQAQDAFQKALTLDPKGDAKQLAEVFRKLAETKLQTGKLEEAKAMIESAVAYEKQSKTTGSVMPPAGVSTSASPRSPAKMIITVGKRHLDDVGAGKITPDEFRKQLKVELIPALSK